MADAENLAPTAIRFPDPPARSELLYRLSSPGPRGGEWLTLFPDGFTPLNSRLQCCSCRNDERGSQKLRNASCVRPEGRGQRLGSTQQHPPSPQGNVWTFWRREIVSSLPAFEPRTVQPLLHPYRLLYGSIIIRDSNKIGWKACPEFVWLRIRRSGGLL